MHTTDTNLPQVIDDCHELLKWLTETGSLNESLVAGRLRRAKVVWLSFAPVRYASNAPSDTIKSDSPSGSVKFSSTM